MAIAADELISVGGLAERLGHSPSTIKFWERMGVIPPATRVSGDNRRVWRVSEIPLIEARIASRRGRHVAVSAVAA